jgi:hypothetical protein
VKYLGLWGDDGNSEVSVEKPTGTFRATIATAETTKSQALHDR